MKKFLFIVVALFFSAGVNAQQEIKTEFFKAQIAGKSGGEITLEDITNGGKIQVNHPDFHITEFSLTIYKPTHKITQTSHSDKFTPEMLELLKGLKPGEIFIIENIKAVNSTGITNWLDALRFTVK